jgi:hypothetical protein
VNPRERFAAATLVSLALHALVLYAVGVPLAPSPEDPRPLEARIVSAPPPVARPAPVVKPAPRRSAPAAQRAAPPVPSVPAPGPVALAPQPEPETAPAPQEPAPAAPEPPAPPQQVASVAPPGPEPIIHSLPKRGRITYTLLYGEVEHNVGQVVQSWEAGDGTYKLASDAVTTGIVEFFRPQRLRYMSRGRITAQGLRPDSFLMSRTRRGQTEAARARFDWNARSLVYGNAREEKNAALAAGAQDVMSFIYQLALIPPSPGRFPLAITTGFRFETYEIEVRSEERIETPIGTLRALPVRQKPTPGEESIEVWLAAEYRYLPVRIRYYDRDGKPTGEQVVSEIRLSEE